METLVMTDDLVKRLRKIEPDTPGIRTRWHSNPDGPEAADRIEQQDRLLALTGTINAQLMELSIEQKDRITDLEKRNAELEAALQGIFEEANGDFPDIGDIKFTASAALGEKN
jgi:hypothetical protein